MTKIKKASGSIGLKITYIDNLQRASDYGTSLGLTLGSNPSSISNPPRDPSKQGGSQQTISEMETRGCSRIYGLTY